MDDRIAKMPPAALAKIDTNMWTAPFWAAAARHELRLSRCAACGLFRMPPTPFCPRCHAQAIDWAAPPGEAHLYSYTIVDREIMPGMADCLPYVPAIVEFPDADHVRLISNIVGSPISAIAIGQTLALGWRDLDGGAALPVFSSIQTAREDGF